MKVHMRKTAARRWLFAAILFLIAACGVCRAQPAVELPKGVKAVWDLAGAYREATPTRERICINGLWRWQPARDIAGPVPESDWGYFKAPGFWPGLQDWQQEDNQTCFVHPAWKDVKLNKITAAWYQRQITVPNEWLNRRIALSAEYVNSLAVVFLDGRKAGEIRFPAGEVDLTAQCRPGATHTLSLLVIALPLKAVMTLHNDTAGTNEVPGSVQRRGLCGDVYLVSTPAGPRISSDVKVSTSVRRWEASFEAGLEGLAPEQRYSLRAEVSDHGRRVLEAASEPFAAGDLKAGRFAFSRNWKPEKLWDTSTPENLYEVSVSLLDAAGNVLDAALPERFGFREFWIDGRDFYLNGSRIFLSAEPLENAQMGVNEATYEGARETLLRLKSFGINFVYGANYGCEPGTHVSFAEILRAADDVGMLVAFSQPHFLQYDWQSPDADRTNGYARHAEFYVRAAQNHPAIVAYAMSHNATGYVEAMNPDRMDGIKDPREHSWDRRNAEQALRAEAIVRRLDPGRIVYHHSSGDLGAMYTQNFYPNFVPAQEMDDWFEHWSAAGVKPLFLCEFGAPMTWDFAMYRGWYKGVREWGGATVPWELCLAEWNSQFFGDRAFRISEVEKACLRWESRQFRAGALWHRWDYPYQMGTPAFEEQYAALALYITDNWRALRTWGVSAINRWECASFWKLRDAAEEGRRELAVDWDHLQRPGFSPDYVLRRADDAMPTSFERADWIPTPAAEALLRNNMPLLAYIGGGPVSFTSKDHNFRPGEAIAKQLIVINDSRGPVTCDCDWSLSLPRPLAGTKQIAVGIGEQGRIPLSFELPAELAPGPYELTATVKFSTGESQQDAFAVNVVPPAESLPDRCRIALFDPRGETAKLLTGMNVAYQAVEAQSDLSAYGLLLIGKEALTVNGPAPDLSRVRDGLRVVVFEQTGEALEKRLGFRTAEYGLRQVFKRVPDHPLLAGLDAENLRDWRGEATILPPRLNYRIGPAYDGTTPTVEWCGMEVPRLWRCGCRGNVASVLIEKPARGDFLPILDGGFSLQYSPLMEYREGKGMILFCQVDVTGRTERDPAAESLAGNILRYACEWKPRGEHRQALYAGGSAGRHHLERAGIAVRTYEGEEKLSPDQVLIVGSGGGKELAQHAAAVAEFLKTGGILLALGLDEQEANSFLPSPVRTDRQEHIATYFDPFGGDSLLAGIGPADVHDRSVRKLPLITSGATPVGDGVLAKAPDSNVLFCQLLPWEVSSTEGAAVSFQTDRKDPVAEAEMKQREPSSAVREYSFKRTYRRASFLLTRLLANMGVAGDTPLLARFSSPLLPEKPEKRWEDGLYLDQPEAWDDPYRFFCW